MTKDNKYNGWTNYATWRINLEVFDGMDAEMFDLTLDSWDLRHVVQDIAEEIIFSQFYDDSKPSSLMEDYARAFLQEVNWHEIAEHLIADYAIEEQ